MLSRRSAGIYSTRLRTNAPSALLDVPLESVCLSKIKASRTPFLCVRLYKLSALCAHNLYTGHSAATRQENPVIIIPGYC